MAKTADEMIRGAFARARERVVLAHYTTTNAGGFDVYSVGSSTDPDVAYTVTVDGAERYRCTCPAELLPACWHRAAVYVRRANDRARAEHLAREAGLMDPPAAPSPAAPRRLPPRDYYDKVELQARPVRRPAPGHDAVLRPASLEGADIGFKAERGSR